MNEVLLFVVPVLIGLALLLLSRWARARNEKLSAHGRNPKQGGFLDAFRTHQYREGTRLFFFGNLSPVEERIGKALALGVVVILVAALVLLLVLLATK